MAYPVLTVPLLTSYPSKRPYPLFSKCNPFFRWKNIDSKNPTRNPLSSTLKPHLITHKPILLPIPILRMVVESIIGVANMVVAGAGVAVAVIHLNNTLVSITTNKEIGVPLHLRSNLPFQLRRRRRFQGL